MSAIIQASPREKFSQERLPTGDSCVLIFFGASGDLTKRKLIPGLYNLSCVGCMNPEFEVLGIGRTPMSSEAFGKKTGDAAAKSKDTRDFSEPGWTDFGNAAALHGRRHQRSEFLFAVCVFSWRRLRRMVRAQLWAGSEGPNSWHELLKIRGKIAESAQFPFYSEPHLT